MGFFCVKIRTQFGYRLCGGSRGWHPAGYIFLNSTVFSPNLAVVLLAPSSNQRVSRAAAVKIYAGKKLKKKINSNGFDPLLARHLHFKVMDLRLLLALTHDLLSPTITLHSLHCRTRGNWPSLSCSTLIPHLSSPISTTTHVPPESTLVHSLSPIDKCFRKSALLKTFHV